MSGQPSKKRKRHTVSTRTRGTIFDPDSLSSVDRTSTRTSRQQENDRIEREREEMIIRRTSELRQQLDDASQQAGVYDRTDADLAEEDIWDASRIQLDAGDADDSDWEDEHTEMVIICGDTRRGRRRSTLDKEERARRFQEAWRVDMPELLRAHLQHKHGLVREEALETPAREWTIIILGLRELDWACPIIQRQGESANTALLRRGLLGASPVSPSIAFTIELLELYHQLRRHQPSLSIQAMVRTLCSIHNLTYRLTYRQQFSDAFDAYLAILRGVQQQTDTALGRAFNWSVTNQCAACANKLPGEDLLHPTMLLAMDGNESLKRVTGWGHTDKRDFESAFFISPADVDKFKNDVKHRTRGPRGEDRSAVDEKKACTVDGHWKTANSSEISTETFDECGAFVSVCRHHLVKTFCPMIRSGELAKYGLATVDRLLDLFGNGQGIGYDIGCTHRITIASSTLADKVKAMDLDITVDAFHGYAHNRRCQLKNHPLFREGYGLEDLASCKRVFSASNAVARLVRHASKFHYGQYIDLHYRHWNGERYAELSKFINDNYKQALQVIKEGEYALEQWRAATHDFSDQEIEGWRLEELQYLESVAVEDDLDVRIVAYVEALQNLESAQRAVNEMRNTIELVQYPVESGKLSVEEEALVRAREAKRAALQHKLDACIGAANDTERLAGVTERWAASDERYIAALRYVETREFERILTRLEGLVVQRLGELSKANLSGVCYKMRKHIAQGLAKRSEAIRTALSKYNTMAPRQDPPRPRIEYRDIVTYAFLGEFELLKHSKHGILQRPWSTPSNRQMADKYHKVKRAKEELVRSRVEARRLRDWVDKEDAAYESAIAAATDSDPLLASELTWAFKRQRRVNNVHRARLQKLYALPTFGIPYMVDEGSNAQPPALADSEDGVVDDVAGNDAEGIDEDDSLNDEALRLGDFMTSIHL